jgi:hypothetical protein
LSIRNEFTKCLFIINDHLEPKEVDRIEELPIEEQKKLFTELTIRGLSFTNKENLAHLLARYYELFFEIPKKFEAEAFFVDISKVFYEATGLDLVNYFALGFSVLVHYHLLNIENINELPIHIDSKTYFRNTSINRTQVNGIFKELCLSREEFKERYQEELADSDFIGYSFLTLRKKPLLKIGRNVYSISNRYLEEKITQNIYHIILNALPTGTLREGFLSFFGKIFEAYVKSIFKRIYPEQYPLKRFYDDIYYGKEKKEAADGIVIYDDSLIIVEVKSSRLLASTIKTGDLTEYEEKIDQVIIKGARTIDRVIQDFKKGIIEIDGLKKERIRRFYPLIITLQFFPQHSLLWEIIERKLSDNNLLQREDIARLQIMEVGVLENLEPAFSTGVSFLDIIKRKDANPLLKDLTFTNFIDADKSLQDIGKNEYMHNKYNKISEKIKAIMFGNAN